MAKPKIWLTRHKSVEVARHGWLAGNIKDLLNHWLACTLCLSHGEMVRLLFSSNFWVWGQLSLEIRSICHLSIRINFLVCERETYRYIRPCTRRKKLQGFLVASRKMKDESGHNAADCCEFQCIYHSHHNRTFQLHLSRIKFCLWYVQMERGRDSTWNIKVRTVIAHRSYLRKCSLYASK